MLMSEALPCLPYPVLCDRYPEQNYLSGPAGLHRSSPHSSTSLPDPVLKKGHGVIANKAPVALFTCLHLLMRPRASYTLPLNSLSPSLLTWQPQAKE